MQHHTFSNVHLRHTRSLRLNFCIHRIAPHKVYSSRHFRREKIYSSGLEQPEDIIQHCLTLLRRSDVRSLTDHLPRPHRSLPSPSSPLTPPDNSITLGNGIIVHEQGPLAFLHPILDVGARRVLPGHLLRRSRVLGTLRIRPDEFQQRIALTARSGEESIFHWYLKKCESTWVITKIEREAALCELPNTPQPKASPESVILAQLNALKTRNIFEASLFNEWRVEGNDNRADGKASLANMTQFSVLSSLMSGTQTYAALVAHEESVFGPAALPTQKSMLQEVWIKSRDMGHDPLFSDGDHNDKHDDAFPEPLLQSSIHSSVWLRYIWKMKLSRNGCWMCSGIEPIAEETPSQHTQYR